MDVARVFEGSVGDVKRIIAGSTDKAKVVFSVFKKTRKGFDQVTFGIPLNISIPGNSSTVIQLW